MQKLIVVALLLSYSAFAQETRTRLIHMKCAPETESGLDTTPQSPPLDVDDPGTPGCNHWEINLVLDGDTSRSEKTWELPLLDLNYGVGDNLQLKYEVPYETVDADNHTTSSKGSGKFGVKYKFFENDSTDTELAFYPQFQESGELVQLPLLFSRKIGENQKGDVMLTANIGYNIVSSSEEKSFISSAVGIGAPLLRRTSIMSEFSTEQAIAKNIEGIRDQTSKIDVGVIQSFNKYVFAFASFGKSVYSSDHEEHTYTVAGLRVLK